METIRYKRNCLEGPKITRKTTKPEKAHKRAYTRKIQLGANGYHAMPTREIQLEMSIRNMTRTIPLAPKNCTSAKRNPSKLMRLKNISSYCGPPPHACQVP